MNLDEINQIAERITSRLIIITNAQQQQQQQQQQRQNFDEKFKLEQRLESELLRCKVYDDKSLQQQALSQIPHTSIRSKALHSTSQSSSYEEQVLRHLLAWFKTAYFTWVTKLPCWNCGKLDTIPVQASPTAVELSFRAHRVECFKCPDCSSESRFPRYNDVRKLMDTRRGRCGEWANVFTLFVRAMGIDARYILDTTDHVWTEARVGDRWVHLDSCEAAYDQPMIYEKGWGKELVFVFSFGTDTGVTDVLRRYSMGNPGVYERRAALVGDEAWIGQCIDKINERHLVRHHHHNDSERANFLQRRLHEHSDLEACRRRTAPKPGEMVGRCSGALDSDTQRHPPLVAFNWHRRADAVLLLGGDVRVNGSARILTSTPLHVILTPDKPDCAGSVWMGERLSKALLGTVGFCIQFTFQITGSGGGDGLSLVFHGASTGGALGRGGSGIGYDGILGAVVLEIDTCASWDLGDPDGNHISIGCTASTQPLPSFKDGREYGIRFVHTWDAGSLVYLSSDGGSAWELVVVSGRINGSSIDGCLFGFTAATGALFERHDVYDVQLYGLL